MTNQSNVTNNVSGDARFGLANVAVAGSQWDNITGTSAADQALKVSGATSGAKLTFRAGATWSVNDPSTALGNTNALLGSFLDDGTAITVDGDNSTFAAEITVSGIPFETYDVYLYSNVNNGSGFKPIQVNGTYYTYANGATVSTEDTSAQWGATAQTTPQLGQNVLVVSGVTGDALTIRTLKRIMQGNGTNNIPRGSFAGFQIVEVLPSISVNFAGDESGTYSVPIPETSEAYGLFPVPGSEWENGFTGSGTIQVSSAYGSSETFLSTLSYKSKNIWHNTDSYDTLLQTYLDDGTDTTNNISGASISMDNVPFTEYAVIVYCAGGNSAFLPVTVNGKTYTWSDTDNATVEGSANFGSSSVTTPTLGQNALCVTGLTDAALTVQGQSGGENTARGGIAAIQIICTGEVDASLAPAPEAETSVISLNFGSNYGSVPQTADNTYGLIPVPGYTWTNISGARGSQTVTVASGKPLTKEPTVAYDSNLTYYYNQATDPFLKGYLGDGQRSEGVDASVTVSNLPFWAYDVVVYAGLGDNGAVARPVRVNGTLYTWDSERRATIATDDETAAYGGIQPTAQYGRNALRVKGLSDYEYKLTIQGLPRSDSQRGGIAAIQIVERKVIQNDNIGDLDDLSSDTPVHILLTAQISGNLTLPPDAILDLSTYWLYGATPPITGTLTVNEGTQIRLPKGASWTIAGTIEGADSLADNAVIVDGSLATGVKVSGGTISADATYVWTGSGKNYLWSNQYNWSSHTVPDAEADVTIPLAANGAVTIELPSDAVAKSVTITGPESGAATLALTSAEGATGSLTISGQMLTTGNVTVAQSSDITVQGTTETYSTGVGYPEQPCQAGFHVHGATWKIASGTLAMPTDGEANTGEAGISGGGTLIVGGGDASEATLAVRQIRPIMYGKVFTSANGTLRVAAGGTLTASNAVSLAVNYGHTYTVDLAGGTIKTPTLATFAGVTVSAASTLRAPEGRALAVTASGSNDALTGAGGVTLSGAVTIASALATYSGTLTVSAGSALTLSGNARPSLVLEDGVAEDKKTALTVTTPSTGEAALGEIVFTTAMKAEPANVDYTVAGKEVTASVADGTLKLSWAVAYPTLAKTGSWSEVAKWTTGTVPTTGVAILDGTSAPITVTLDTALTGMTSIVVRGDVSLKTTGAQATIPACVTLAEGATLGVGATSFGGTWALPAGTTLRIEDAGFSLANIQTVNSYTQFEGNVEIDFSDGIIGDSAEKPIRIDGTLSIKGNNVTFTNLGLLAGDVDLSGDRICLDRKRHAQGDGATSRALGIGSDGTTTLTNRGNGNRIAHATRLNGTIDVQSGSLALLTEQPGDVSTTSSAYHATIAEGATLILEEGCAGGQYPATGAGTYAVGTNRPQFAAVGGATTTPAIITATATADEQSAGTITFANYQSAVSFPEGFEAKIMPYGTATPWVTVAKAGGNTLRILNVPAPNGLSGLNDAVALTLRQAAAKEGITNGDYTVQLTTKGGQTTIASPDAATLNDVLGCFTGLTATADGTTLTYAYDFGIVGIKRNTTGNGWVVTAKVQGEGAVPAGFAADNAYTLTVNGAPAADASATVGENGTVTFTVLDASVAGETCTLGVKVSRPAQTLAQ